MKKRKQRRRRREGVDRVGLGSFRLLALIEDEEGDEEARRTCVSLIREGDEVEEEGDVVDGVLGLGCARESHRGGLLLHLDKL